MPNIKSAKKRVKVSSLKNLRRKSYMSSLRTIIKNAVNKESSDKDIVLKNAIKKLDQAVSKGILHKNSAARKKARMIRAVRSN